MKIKELQTYMKKNSIDNCILFNNSTRFNPNFFYFSQKNFDGAMIISVNKPSRFVMSRLDAETKAKNIALWSKGKFPDFIKEVVGKTKRIGLDMENLTVKGFRAIRKTFPKTKLINVSDICHKLRSTKTDEELERIRKAAKVTQEILAKCIQEFNKFKKESDVVQFLKIETIERGCELAFEPIVASGANASIPHYHANARLRKGFCIIDYGAKYKGYCADLTRTLYIGMLDTKQKQLLEKNISVELDIIDLIKPGIRTDMLYKTANKLLEGKLIHAIGHGVGIEVHEQPFLGEKDSGKIAAGMTLSIEPATYVPKKYGIRTEDMVCVTDKKTVLLSKPQGIIRV